MPFCLNLASSGVTGGGGGSECTPRDFPPGNFWWLIGKNEAREKVKNGKIRKNGRGKEEKWENEKMK